MFVIGSADCPSASQHGVQNVYSPTHAITLKREGDNAVDVTFNKKQGLLDKDFQLFYQLGDKDVGLTAITHRPVAAENGFAMMLVTPKVEIKKEYQVPRDMVLVLDTSGSMRGPKMEQARKALKYSVAGPPEPTPSVRRRICGAASSRPAIIVPVQSMNPMRATRTASAGIRS